MSICITHTNYFDDKCSNCKLEYRQLKGSDEITKNYNEKKELRNRIISRLKEQGFILEPNLRLTNYTKKNYKFLQVKARQDQLAIHKRFILKTFDIAKKYSIDGNKINPEKISLRLIEIKERTIEEKLFRWWNFIWWSIPYQHPYGRQLRFLLWDDAHDAPFGLINLQSPIFKMSVRDKFLEIPKEELDVWVNRSLSAQRVGALPPYNELIGGKMVALAMTSNEVRNIYKNKYKNSVTLLRKRKINADLLFITTTSAFGKSSIYDRLKYQGEIVAQSLGYTQGFGSFHLPDEIYYDLIKFLQRNGINALRQYGNGPSRKLKLLHRAFTMLGLDNFSLHGIKREFYLFPLVKNLKEVITLEQKPLFYDRNLINLTEYWKTRWANPRSKNFTKWKDFKSEKFFKKQETELMNI